MGERTVWSNIKHLLALSVVTRLNVPHAFVQPVHKCWRWVCVSGHLGAPTRRLCFKKPFRSKAYSNSSPGKDLLGLLRKQWQAYCQADLGLSLSLRPCRSAETPFPITEMRSLQPARPLSPFVRSRQGRNLLTCTVWESNNEGVLL